jgi:hypothetical protein
MLIIQSQRKQMKKHLPGKLADYRSKAIFHYSFLIFHLRGGGGKAPAGGGMKNEQLRMEDLAAVSARVFSEFEPVISLFLSFFFFAFIL